MFQFSTLRAVIRRLGLSSLISPMVARLEDRRLSSYGSYEVRRVQPGSLEFRGFGKTVQVDGLPADLCATGLSRHERPTILAVLSRISRGAIAWDVGANVGFYSILMSAVSGPAGSVIAFEPCAGTFTELEKNVAANSNIHPVCKGLSDADGNARFSISPGHSSIGRIIDSNVPGDDTIATIITARGDSLISSGGLPAPHFIKVDVEGHELQALQGMTQVLSNNDCKAVLIEVHFAVLEKAGHANAPKLIQSLLNRCGLCKQQWIARSHLLAERP